MPDFNDTFTPIRMLPIPSLDEAAEAPDNSEIRKVADAVLQGLQYSFAAVAADPSIEAKAGSLEAEAKVALAALPEVRRRKYTSAGKSVMSDDRTRKIVFGNAGSMKPETFVEKGGFDQLTEHVTMPKLDPKLLGMRTDRILVPLDRLNQGDGTLSVESGASLENLQTRMAEADVAAQDSGLINEERMDDIWGRYCEGDPFGQDTVSGDFEPFATTNKLGLWVSQVKCVDETNPEFWGHDEIALAGVSVDEDGDVKKIAETYIGGGFDDGDAKSYPNWRYTWFNLNEGKYWPKRYSVSFLLAEKDNGGLSDFLQSVWDKVRDQVKKAIEEAVGGVVSAYLGKAIGAAIGKAVAWVVDVFVKWIIGLFKDDLFPVKTVAVTTPSASARWRYPNGTWGNPSSGTRVSHFYGHGGHYTISWHWLFHS